MITVILRTTLINPIFARLNTIMKWCLYVPNCVCFASSRRISGVRARMRNANQTQCCTHAFPLVSLLAFQRSAIAVVCQHRTIITKAGSFSYLSFDSWSKGNDPRCIFSKYITFARAFHPREHICDRDIPANTNVLRFGKKISLGFITKCVAHQHFRVSVFIT